MLPQRRVRIVRIKEKIDTFLKPSLIKFIILTELFTRITLQKLPLQAFIGIHI